MQNRDFDTKITYFGNEL